MGWVICTHLLGLNAKQGQGHLLTDSLLLSGPVALILTFLVRRTAGSLNSKWDTVNQTRTLKPVFPCAWDFLQMWGRDFLTLVGTWLHLSRPFSFPVSLVLCLYSFLLKCKCFHFLFYIYCFFSFLPTKQVSNQTSSSEKHPVTRLSGLPPSRDCFRNSGNIQPNGEIKTCWQDHRSTT